MEDWDKIQAVKNMQEYIVRHAETEIDMNELATISGYSRYHSIRLFKQYTGQTPSEYIRALRLSHAAVHLRDTNERVLETALNASFESHDGFTRAFSRQFGIGPAAYQKATPPISLFTYYPITHALLHYKKRIDTEMSKVKVPATVTAQTVDRPARKLMILRSQKAEDYMSFCGEMGCDWEGMMNSVSEKFDNAALLELPKHLVIEGTSAFVAGIEIPMNYEKPIPENMEILELPACKMLYFRGTPYENEEDFCEAIEIAAEAIRNYKPEEYGLAYAFDIAPRFNFGASAQGGAKMAVPVAERK